MARPGTTRSTGPSPATVTTSKPNDVERVRPRRGHDRHAVGEAEAEGDEGAGGHGQRGGRGDDGGLGMSGDTLSAVEAHALLERHWRPPGFCVPNATTYPWQWLWDSCFHAVCWAHLGEGGRAVAELGNVLAHQAADGFVPHLTYWDGPTCTPTSGVGRARRRSPSRRCTAMPSPSSSAGGLPFPTPPWPGPAGDWASCWPARARAGSKRRPGADHRAPLGVGLRRQPPMGCLVSRRLDVRPLEGAQGRPPLCSFQWSNVQPSGHQASHRGLSSQPDSQGCTMIGARSPLRPRCPCGPAGTRVPCGPGPRWRRERRPPGGRARRRRGRTSAAG